MNKRNESIWKLKPESKPFKLFAWFIRVDAWLSEQSRFNKIVVASMFGATIFLGVLMLLFSNSGVTSEGSEWEGYVDPSTTTTHPETGFVSDDSISMVIDEALSVEVVTELMDVGMLMVVLAVVASVLASIVRVLGGK